MQSNLSDPGIVSTKVYTWIFISKTVAHVSYMIFFKWVY